jgi:amidohydrolase
MSQDWKRQLDEAIERRFERIVEVRRRLHARPEVSGEERETSLYLYQLLGEEGFQVRMGPEGRGVLADSEVEGNGRPAARLALRADIDALRIHEKNDVPYASQCPGVMHACGHDAHTALIYGAVTAIEDLRTAGSLPWEAPIRGIFQPAEETSEGARDMIDIGALDGVSAILSAHVDPMRDLGHIGLRAGVLTANCDEMELRIQGQGGHAARPHEARDSIAAAAQLINSLYLFIPRATDSQDAVVVTVGQIRGGDNANVIPEEVTLRGTVRTLDAGVRQKTCDHIRQLAHGVGETTDTRIEVHFGLGSASVNNDASLIDLLRQAGREVVRLEGIDEIPRASMGSEDFSFYLEKVPGAMIRLGVRSSSASGSALHTPNFDIDEEALRIGAKVLARAAILWHNPSPQRASAAYEYTI